MWITLIVFIFIAGIFFCLADAAVMMIKKKHAKEAMVKALTWRIGLSILLFLLICINFALKSPTL